MIPTTMRAAVFHGTRHDGAPPLTIEERPVPTPAEGESLLKVLACGVCRTDLHIVEGDLPFHLPSVIPGHQIVGEVVTTSSSQFQVGDRVGVSWMGGTDGTCKFCKSNRENLCDAIAFTGYSRDGGYAEYVTARTDFLIPLTTALPPQIAAPLLCAGMIGFRSLRVAEVKPGQKVGIFGFGASARLVMPVLHMWGCEVYVATRGERHRQEAAAMGATWVGDAFDLPPTPLDAAVIFAPVGSVVLAGLKSLDKGGILSINAIHLDQMPAFDYDTILWHERQIRSVANMTRQDAKDFMSIAEKIRITPAIKVFSLEQANEALAAIKDEDVVGSAVIVP
ncbi:zinc-binding alcohol dehydrogenase family protein [Terriglobus roseus DSM 18391]|uniref:Zinc-binding alcohol dehydrogenase family protein n=1 Tax=Terriglobus roseus (strain DSM 18391 / NRRL B-41598 / KBS 63) TaxID=926566 RepID=I3ZGU4_TERRK|nr:zinc-dependent alcohol dehydrogenase family protein [Terriglobus roseus]AFL88462.1 zinc-binding alcohol dehydrogenase family protein [Terriglobus roseus DSM 18391]AFL88804.1 zinc-binding alcohol dehydrogenase family protein [Terriglobus roseus DSM 18391]